MGGTGLKLESWKVYNHIKNASEHHFYCLLREFESWNSAVARKVPPMAQYSHTHTHTNTCTRTHTHSLSLSHAYHAHLCFSLPSLWCSFITFPCFLLIQGNKSSFTRYSALVFALLLPELSHPFKAQAQNEPTSPRQSSAKLVTCTVFNWCFTRSHIGTSSHQSQLSWKPVQHS